MEGDLPATAADAALWIDRFLSASSSKDAVDSVQWMAQKARAGELESAWAFDNQDLVMQFISLLRTERHSNNFPCEEGVAKVLQIYVTLAKTNASQCLQVPAKGQLLECLLDTMGDSQRSDYDRVLALQVLKDLSLSREAENQWLEAPNGLHRLADVLGDSSSEVVRNEALLVANVLAKHAAVAKVWIFAEVETQLLDLCWQEGGLTNGNPIVIDALKLVKQILRAADISLLELVWQRPNLPLRLTQLVDLRGGTEFRFPDAVKSKKAKSDTLKQAGGSTDDDLDSLLQTGGSKQVAKPEKSETEAPYVPHLIQAEEDVIRLVLEILGQLLEVEDQRRAVWTQQAPMCSLIWELALCAPSLPPVCAIPSPELQQFTLEAIAQYFNDPQTMDRHAGMDRLLAIVCTGGSADMYKEKFGLSQAALHVLRTTIAKERIHEYLSHTLAPPPPLEEDGGAEPAPTVVHKLWNTVAEQLQQNASPMTADRALLLSGALGGLSIFFEDVTSREIMLRVTPGDANMGVIITTLYQSNDSATNNQFEEDLQLAILRFLCEWLIETPPTVQSMLSSSESSYLITMASKSSANVQSLVHLLLGLAMEYIGDESQCGGWTRSGILQIIESIGIPKFVQSLERMKTATDLPWNVCQPELKIWDTWYTQTVWRVRKRVVAEISGSSQNDDDDGDNDESPDSGRTANAKSLQKVVAQQASELDELRSKLEEAEKQVSMQQGLVDTWKRRMESTPTQLDELLTELTSKNADLENKVTSLHTDLSDVESKHRNELEVRDEKTLAVKQDLTASEEREKLAEEAREQMEEELKGLSAAYCTLEEECRNYKTKAESSQKSESKEPVASDTPGASSTEMTALRADNSRLRQDAKKADEWMAMAVARMNGMAEHNLKLEGELTLLQTQSQASQPKKQDSEEMQQMKIRLDQALDIEGQLNQKLASASEALAQAGQTLQKHNVAMIEEKAKHSEQDAATASKFASLQEQLESELQEKKNAMLELATAHEEARCAREELDQHKLEQQKMEDRLSAVDEEMRELKLSIEAKATNETEETKSGEDRLDASFLQQQLEAVQSELNDKTSHWEQVIYTHEATIRELKDRLGNGLGSYSIKDIEERDSEIIELKEANETAQEWMSKAVEHHTILQNSITATSEEKARLARQLAELSANQKDDSALASLQGQVEDRSSQLQAISEKFNQSELEVKRLTESLSDAEEKSHQLEIALDEVTSLRSQLKIVKEQLDGVKQSHTTMPSKEESEILQRENDELKDSVTGLTSRLADFEDWASQVQTRIAEMLAEKDGIHKSLQQTNDELDRIKGENIEKETEILRKNEELESVLAAKNDLSEELDRMGQELRDLERTPHNETHLSQNIEGDDGDADDNNQNWPNPDGNENDGEAQIEGDTNLPIEVSDHENDDDLNLMAAEISTNNGQDAGEAALESSPNRDAGNYANDQHELDVEPAVLVENQDGTEHVRELESTLADLHRQLHQQQEESNVTIADLRLTCSQAEERCQELEQQLQQAKIEDRNSTDLVEQTIAEDHDSADSCVYDKTATNSLAIALAMVNEELKQKNEQLQAAVETVNGDEQIVREWEAQVEKLQAFIAELETQLQQQESDAEQVIAQWQDACGEVEERCSALQKQLSEGSEDVVASSELAESLESQRGELQIEIDSLRAQLLHYQHMSDDVQHAESSEMEHMVTKQESLEKVVAVAENEKQLLLNEVTQLHEELKSAKELAEGHKGEADILRLALSETEQSLEAAKTLVVNDESVVEQWEERVKDLQDAMDILQEQLAQQEEEARAAIGQWQESYDGIEAKCAELEKDLQARMCESDSCKSSMNKLQQDLANLQQERDAMNIHAQNAQAEKVKAMEELSVARQKLRDTDLMLKEAQTSSMDGDSVLSAWQERAERFEQEVREMEGQLKTQEDDATAAIEKWQEAVEQAEIRSTELEDEMEQKMVSSQVQEAKLTEQIETLTVQLKTMQKAVENMEEEMDTTTLLRLKDEAAMNDLRQELSEKQSLIDELQANMQTLKDKMDQAASSHEVESRQMQEQIETLESASEEISRQTKALTDTNAAAFDEEKSAHSFAKDRVNALEKEMEEIRKESEAAIAQWAGKSEELEATVTSLEEQLKEQESDATEAIKCWEEKAAELETELDEVEKTKLEVETIRSKLKTIEEDHLSAMNKLKAESREELFKERERLTIVIGKLEEEIAESNEMVQTFVTDEISDKATQVVAESLRIEIDQLRAQLRDANDALAKERSYKDTAKREVARLKEELTALLSLEGDEHGINDVKLLSIKAAEKLQNKERLELERLRKALRRSLNDLESARSSEKDSVDKLAKFRLQVSVCEQETIAAKSDLNFMAEAMEELRESEESRRSSLEYRINSLENDREVQNRFHSGEIENLRNEISQLSMEKDRILQSLKESEKTKAALMFAASKGETDSSDEQQDTQTLISELRIENAHLLAVAADDASRAERRLRESMAAHTSSVEADVMLERELRISAEATVKNVTIQIETLREELRANEISIKPDGDDDNERMMELTERIENLKTNLKKETDGNDELKRQLKEHMKKTKAEIQSLNDEYRKAQAKAHLLEREVRFEAAVSSEVSRLRLSGNALDNEDAKEEWMLVESQSQNKHDGEVHMSVAAAYDIIREQRESIVEERKLHMELLSEHEDLLALLTQQNNEKQSLIAVLETSVGSAAVEEAIKAAESKSLSEHGGYVRVS